MIDLVFAILMILAIVKGYQKGLVIALFSIIALVVGLAAALKLSAVVAMYLQHSVIAASKWLPVISFALVFFVVVVLVQLGGRLVEKTFEIAFMGWLNRIGGILLYAVLYAIIYSVCLFYADKINVLQKATIESSYIYPMVQPVAPVVINGIGNLVPLFKDTFQQLEDFFANVSNKIQQ